MLPRTPQNFSRNGAGTWLAPGPSTVLVGGMFRGSTLTAWFHAIADYAVGILLIVVAIAADGSAGATATGVVVGAVVLLVSALTRYPLGIAKVLPFTIHSAGDYLAAALLIAAPFALNFADAESGLAAFYVVMGVAVLAVSLVTNYQYSPKRAQDGMSARPVTA